MSSSFRLTLANLSIVYLAVFAGCSGGQGSATPITAGQTDLALLPAQTAWPGALPADGVQPWETLDGNGNAVPVNGRQPSAFDSDMVLNTGSEYFMTGGTTTEQGAVLQLTSASGATAYSIYRLGLAGDAPGVLTLDVNLTAGAGYYVGLADYGNGRWQWAGPFREHNPCFDMAHQIPAGAEFLSEFGNALVAVLVFDTAAADVVGVGIARRDPADIEAPLAPSAPAVTAVPGGLLLEWQQVVAPDTAGYRIYFNQQPFFDGRGTGVRQVPYLEAGSNFLIHTISETYLRIAAVDKSGNESVLSPLVDAVPLNGAGATLNLTLSSTSGVLNDEILLTASGAESYDFDVDGDGAYDIVGQSSGLAQVETGASGMLRPAVRGSSGGVVTALGGVSLIISGNSRPVAFAAATPQSGPAPLTVTLSGNASTDFDGEIVGGGWDLDGDGIFEAEVWDDTDIVHVVSAEHIYTEPGLYNAKLQVIDDQGTWDIDTVAILVSPPGNQTPFADLQAAITAGDAPLSVEFNATGSSDPDGDPVDYAFDWDGNGGYDEFGELSTLTHIFAEPGLFMVKLRVADGRGGKAFDTLEIDVSAVGNDNPTAELLPVTAEGDLPFTVNFDASGSTAGGDDGDTLVMYEWDFDGNGTYEGYGEDPTIAHTYTAAGLFTPKLRVSDSFGAQATNTSLITVNSPDNPSPNAQFTVSQDNGPAPLVVDFNATASSDDTGIALYEWDWDGDGTYDAYSDTPLAQHVYHLPGQYVVKLRVTDNEGATDTQTDGIRPLGWRSYPAPVDGSVNVGAISAVVHNNLICAAYMYDAALTPDGIRFVRTANTQQTSWEAPVTALANLSFPLNEQLCLAIINGNPAIAYRDPDTDDLRYITANNPEGTAWSSVVIVDSTVDISSTMSLREVNGAPCIAYFDVTNAKLRFVRASNASGTAWNTPQTLDAAATGLNGHGPSLEIINGNPGISYVNVSDNQVKFIRATNGLGTSWGTPAIVRTWTGVGSTTILWDPATNANPTIMALEPSNDGDLLKVIVASNADATTWGNERVLAVNFDMNDFDNSHTGADSVAVFQAYNSFHLYGIDSTWTGTTVWGEPYLIESENNTGEGCQVRIGSGTPVILCGADGGNDGLVGYYRVL